VNIERFEMEKNKNFETVTVDEKEITKLRDRFDKRGFSPQSYSKAYKVDRRTLYDVFSGKATGIKNSDKKTGDVRNILVQLKKDGVWIGRLPWEEK
jgi:hypothetical protein